MGRFRAVQHYSLMLDERILGLGTVVREVAAEQSFCFLWVTTATVPLGIRMLESWGVRLYQLLFLGQAALQPG